MEVDLPALTASAPTPVVVVGAGVVGLSCAVRLAEAGFAVDVRARELPAATTSAVAGGLWLPYLAEPADRVAVWGRDTLRALLHLHETEPAAGVLLRDGVVLHAERPMRPAWSGALTGLVELRTVVEPAPGYGHGLALRVPVVDVPRYLRWLEQRLRRAGGQITEAALDVLPDAALVVDCAGLGARELAGDADLHAVRGQVVVLDNPGLTRWLVDEHEVGGELTYVLPRADDVVVGGSATVGDEDLLPRPDLARRILQRACVLVPELRDAAVRAHRVGLRPARSAVRLDVERTAQGAVVHCYGHGGAGITLSWGCADEVLREVSHLVPADAPRLPSESRAAP